MLTAIVLMALGAEPTKVSMGAFKHVGYAQSVGDIYVEQFASMLGARGLKVTTPHDVEQMLGVERQKLLLGCDEAGSECAAELAGALGADAIATGSIAKTSEGYLVSLRFLSPRRAAPIAAAAGSVATEPLLLEWLNTQAKVLSPQLEDAVQALRAEAEGHGSTWGGRAGPLTCAILGGLAVAGGSVSFGLSLNDQEIIKKSPTPLAETEAISRGQLRQDAGVGLMVAGGVGVIVGLVWGLATRGHDEVGAVQPWVSVNGAGLAWSLP